MLFQNERNSLRASLRSRGAAAKSLKPSLTRSCFFVEPKSLKQAWRPSPTKKSQMSCRPSGFNDFAEREGFEPPNPCRSTVFKTAAIDHSAIFPKKHLCMRAAWSITRLSEAFSSNAGAKIRAFSEIEKSIPTFSQKSCLSSFVRPTERDKKKAVGFVRQPSGIFIT